MKKFEMMWDMSCEMFSVWQTKLRKIMRFGLWNHFPRLIIDWIIKWFWNYIVIYDMGYEMISGFGIVEDVIEDDDLMLNIAVSPLSGLWVCAYYSRISFWAEPPAL